MKWLKRQCVCLCTYMHACVCWYTNTCEEKQMCLKLRVFKWEVLESPLRNCNPSFYPEIVCKTLCLWYDYFLGGHMLTCSSDSQRGFREWQSVILWCLLPGMSFSLKSHNHFKNERSLIFKKHLHLGKGWVQRVTMGIIISGLLSLKLEKTQPDWNRLWQNEPENASLLLQPAPSLSSSFPAFCSALPASAHLMCYWNQQRVCEDQTVSLYSTYVWHIVGIQ